MGFFKQVASAFKPSSIARGLDAARNPPDPEAIEASLEALTPEQRAAYEGNVAAVAQSRAEAQAAWEQAKAAHDDARILRGPAGRYLDGAGMDELGSPEQLEARIAEIGPLAALKEQRALRKGAFTDGLRQAFNRDKVRQVDDPEQRAAIAAAERAARDEARLPYRADDPTRIVISRLSTRGETQVDELVDHLQREGLAGCPDRVFGAYRVPDRISQAVTPFSERGRVVEWDVVHEPLEGATPSAARPVATSFVAAEQWVARKAGDPAVLDEELAVAFCVAAGIGPERCLGVARISELRAMQAGSNDASPIRTLVRGVVAIHPPESSGAFARLQSAAPIELTHAEDVHHEVLNWAALARAVHPKLHQPPPVPSPFPYLPSTPQELLQAYLEVVGVTAADCYGVQATVDEPRALQQGGVMTTNLGARQPCADGKPRMRSHGCEHVVVSYRDRPEYVEGRRRWAAYQDHVLEADLRKGTGVHRALNAAIDVTEGVPTTLLRAAARAAATVDRFEAWGDETVPPYRYCWPLSDADA